MSEAHLCTDCGQLHHVSPAYWHRLTPGLVGALIKVRHAVADKGINSIHNRRDMHGLNELTKTEAANFTKLRFLALVCKDKEAGAGYWKITSRGAAFLRGDLAVPRRVLTQDNKVIGHDEELVYIRDVMKANTPRFESLPMIDMITTPMFEQGRLL